MPPSFDASVRVARLSKKSLAATRSPYRAGLSTRRLLGDAALRQVALDQEPRELALRVGEAAPVLLEHVPAGAGGPELLARGDDPADLLGQALHGVPHDRRAR